MEKVTQVTQVTKNSLNRFPPKKLRSFATLYFLFLLAGLFVFFIAYGMGYRINLSQSTPRGLWRIQEGAELARGSYVTVSPKGNPGYDLALERGYFRENSFMLKKIVAMEGDYVDYDVEERAITVNGDYILLTEILSQDTEGLPMQPAAFPVHIGERQAWLSSEFIRGYDSRYFGPVPSELLKKANPIWIFR